MATDQSFRRHGERDDSNLKGNSDASIRGGDGAGGSSNATRAAGARSAAPGFESYSQRVARMRKPMLTAADKTELSSEERARIYKELRPPRRMARPSGFSRGAAGRTPAEPLRVFCFGVDDVRLYRALQGAGALGRVVVVPGVEDADVVLATRIKRTGKALVVKEVMRAARNAGKPFIELPAVSPIRVMEAVESVTGWPVPAHLRAKPPQPPALLAPLEKDTRGSAAALTLLTGGLPLPEYLAARTGGEGLPPAILSALDRTDVSEDRGALLAVNPQERETQRQRPVTRPHMSGTRMARQAITLEQKRRKAEVEGEVAW